MHDTLSQHEMKIHLNALSKCMLLIVLWMIHPCMFHLFILVMLMIYAGLKPCPFKLEFICLHF